MLGLWSGQTQQTVNLSAFAFAGSNPAPSTKQTRSRYVGAFVWYTGVMSEQHVRVGIGVIVCKDGKFLIQRRKGSHGSGTWSIPGGHLEFNEQFEDTAKREVFEETGVEIKNVRFGALTNDILSDEGKHYVSIWLISDYAGGNERIMEPDKCDRLEWCTFDTIPEPLAPWWKQLLVSEFYATVKQEVEKTAKP